MEQLLWKVLEKLRRNVLSHNHISGCANDLTFSIHHLQITMANITIVMVEPKCTWVNGKRELGFGIIKTIIDGTCQKHLPSKPIIGIKCCILLTCNQMGGNWKFLRCFANL